MVIYLLTNTVNGKRYVGQTVKTLSARWSQHKTFAKNGNAGHNECPITRAIRKYGSDAFTAEVVFTCSDKIALNKAEREYIVSFGTKSPNGYNVTDGGDGVSGWTHSEETRRKIGEANKNKEHQPRSIETRQKVSEHSFNGNKTHCPAGHEYNSTNMYLKISTKRKCRICRTCAYAQNRQRSALKRRAF
jgi:group I intron endonuclease